MSAPSAYPADVPPSMPAGSHEIRDYYSDQDPPRSLPHTAPSITPYLGLRARLSQLPINRWTVLILLVLVRALVAISSIDDGLDSAQTEALSACTKVESAGSTMASMPHFMAQGTNEMTAKGIEKAVNGLIQGSFLGVTAIEELVVFVIGMMTNTYLCLITFAVSGTLQSELNMLNITQNALNTLTKNVGGDLSKATSGFEDAYNSFVNKLKGLQLGLNVVTPPTLDLSSEIAAIGNISLPKGLTDDINKLNNSIPTFDQVKNVTENLIRMPFELLKTEMQEYIGNYSFNRSLLPVPDKQALTFCSDNNDIDKFFDDMVDLTALARRIFLGVLVSLAILVMLPMAWREKQRYEKMKERSRLVKDNAKDSMDVVYLVSRPYTSAAGVKVANSVESDRKKNLIRWVVAYATSEPALFILSLAVAGLLSCACQALLLKAIEKEAPNITAQVGAYTDKVVAALTNASDQWSVGTNDVITSTNQDVNHNMFGWVNVSTTAVNNTLNTFVNETYTILDKFFGGTPLEEPILEVLNCLVLLKIKGIEQGLTWVHDNAHVDFPQVPNDTFSNGALTSLAKRGLDDSFLADPGSDAANALDQVVGKLIKQIRRANKTEVLIATTILCVYIVFVLGSVIRALTLWYGRDKVRGDGGVTNPNVDFRSDNQDRYAGFNDVPLNDLHPKYPTSPAPVYTEKHDSDESIVYNQNRHDDKSDYI
jgi:hypothetical protein